MPEAKPTGRRTGNTRREEILSEVSSCVLRDRQNSYGDAEDNFSDIALRWTNYLPPGHEQLHHHSPRRSNHDGRFENRPSSHLPDHLDNLIDGAGYFVCAGGIAKKRSEG